MNVFVKIEFKIKAIVQIYRQFKHFSVYRNRVFYEQSLKTMARYKLYLDDSSSKIIFKKNIQLKENCKFLCYSNGVLTVNDGVFFNNNCSVNCLHKIEIGVNTIFGESVKIYDHNHLYRDPNVLIKDQGYSFGEIKIGNNCWIGSSVIILKGVTIGDNSVIGAGCVIYKNVPANSIVKNLNNFEIKTIAR